jgi:hypothetical protein
MVVAYVLLAGPIAAALLFWGSWGWVAASLAVAVVEYATLRRSQRFMARFWRSAPLGHRHNRERATETLYVVTTVAGIALFGLSIAAAL